MYWRLEIAIISNNKVKLSRKAGCTRIKMKFIEVRFYIKCSGGLKLDNSSELVAYFFFIYFHVFHFNRMDEKNCSYLASTLIFFSFINIIYVFFLCDLYTPIRATMILLLLYFDLKINHFI